MGSGDSVVATVAQAQVQELAKVDDPSAVKRPVEAASQFTSLRINAYRGIDGLALDDPGRVNLIVGVNNVGKTSLLEAIYLLARQNDERALLEVIRLRGRIEGEADPSWLAEQLPEDVRIEGTFNQGDQNAVRFDRNVGDLTSGEHWLCRSAFMSPFSASRPSFLARCNKESLKAGTKAKIIDFIRKNVDPGLEDIEFVDKLGRFLATHRDFERASDLSSLGAGVRRAFEIGLLFAGVRGGVLLIDELENAMHTSLLADFARLMHKLAVELNVQVFLTTHSKEAIDAFVGAGHWTCDIVGYALRRTEAGVEARRYDGERLLRLLQVVDFDLRGIR